MRRKLAVSFWRLFAAAAVLMITLPYGALPVRAASSSEQFIRNTIERAYAIVDDPSLDEGQRNRELHNFLRSVADVRRVALFTVGHYARRAPQGDINDFVKVFEDYLVARGRDALMRYRDNPIKVTGSTERARDDIVVNAEVLPVSGASGPIRIGFRVRKDTVGNDAIVDFNTEGISLAIIGKVAFTLFLVAHEENLALLAQELVRRIAGIEAGEREASTSAPR